jgi:CDP-diacylglycerol--serine O-phosphatidyltransferase
MVGSVKLASAVTYLGVAAAVTGIGLAVHGRTHLALAMLVTAGIADLFDGPFARHLARRFGSTEQERAQGIAMDSLADTLSFLALPAAILASLDPPAWAYAVVAGYVLAGLTRLAAFDVEAYARLSTTDDAAPATHYRGLPTTYAALVLPVVGLGTALVAPAAVVWALLVGLGALGVAFVANVPVRKPRGAWYAAFAILAVAVFTGLVII